jgi:spore coat polysaccharide biosynthesis predicted glycosyltransferase SpsG
MVGSINPNIGAIKNFIAENKQKKLELHFNIRAAELITLLNKCDLSICPASNIALESCAVGIGLVSGFTAPNQKGNLTGMENHKTLLNLGDMNLISSEEIVKQIRTLIEDPTQLNKMVEHQNDLIDGKSPERLLSVFKELSVNG